MPVRRRAVASWALYDLANTIFSFNILSFYFPVWAKDHMGAADLDISIAFSASMLLVAIASPLFGALSDRVGRRIPFLVATTLVCVVCTSLLGIDGLGLALVLYAVANFFFQLGLVFYDALLPTVSETGNVGSVGGAGVGIGYFGSFVGLATGAYLLATLDDPHPVIFATTAALFALLAIPCFAFVRERGAAVRARLGGIGAMLATLRGTLAHLRTNQPLRRFLLARFIYADAANTMILFMGIYATNEAGFTETTAQFVLGAGIAAAIAGGLIFGRLVDSRGAKRVLTSVLFVWMGTLALAAAIPLLDLPQNAFWLVAIGSGTALGGTWASDRPLMLRLTPAGRVGEFYGIYGMIGRFAAVFGPLVWGLIVDVLKWGRPVAVLALLVAMVLAALVLRTVQVDATRA